ncbi:MAG TPA: TIGR02206 family membrane protein [Pirellulales bacterium]|jgi:hypothetical integral membrane protein (TIGR02206 family)
MPWLWTDKPFVLFGPAHLAAIGLSAAAGILLALAARALRGRTVRGQPAQQLLSRSLAVIMLIVVGAAQAIMLLPEHFVVGRSLPLQICDLAWMVAIYALWTNRRLAFAVVYYWGLTATVLAMLTPDLKQGFPHFYFLLFYLGHGSVVAAAIYLCWGVGLRPDWRLYRFTALVTIVYAVCIYFVNDLLGTDYFCVNRKPAPGTMLDYFGPYPMYILVSALIALSAWAALTWPWQLLAARRGKIRRSVARERP